MGSRAEHHARPARWRKRLRLSEGPGRRSSRLRRGGQRQVASAGHTSSSNVFSATASGEVEAACPQQRLPPTVQPPLTPHVQIHIPCLLKEVEVAPGNRFGREAEKLMRLAAGTPSPGCRQGGFLRRSCLLTASLGKWPARASCSPTALPPGCSALKRPLCVLVWGSHTALFVPLAGERPAGEGSDQL